MIPLWYKCRDGTYLPLTHYPDGTVGIPAVELQTISFRNVHPGDWWYHSDLDRYVLHWTCTYPINE